MCLCVSDRMFLGPPAWAQDFLISSSTSPASGPQAPVAELVVSLTNQRQYREVVLALRTGLRDARAEFSFLRVQGLKKLASLLASAAKSEKIAQFFRVSQGQQDLQVVPTLFHHTLSPPKTTPIVPPDPISCTEPPKVLMPPTIGEIVLALRVLEGCCLLDASSRTLASQHMGVKEILELLWVGGVSERLACLDALLPLLLDSSTNQKELDRLHGIQKIVDLAQNKHVDKRLRYGYELCS
ncbi:hypothetical protein O6H91_11G098400 [Diphasiastrum complanatum]|uniref:Uncharacterized protein n=1 Tax=Diphasiastrum complanatum TaxID=34168 RepID=A0ACC2CCW8_DIPCM|nr:hypothetical protein O6H91_11G098400 [Diphasiastrum complanatum]